MSELLGSSYFVMDVSWVSPHIKTLHMNVTMMFNTQSAKSSARCGGYHRLKALNV